MVGTGGINSVFVRDHFPKLKIEKSKFFSGYEEFVVMFR